MPIIGEGLGEFDTHIDQKDQNKDIDYLSQLIERPRSYDILARHQEIVFFIIMDMVGIQTQPNNIKDNIGDKEKSVDMHEAFPGEKLRSFHFVNAML